MATESLIVELDAKTSKLDSKLKATEKQLDALDGTVTKTGTDFKRMAGIMVAGATVAAAAITMLTKSAVTFAKELEVASKRNRETVENMQQWAFAANTVGVSLEKLGDIGKDTNEKVGEFLATGGGGFQDFVDVMGLTTAQATEMAEEFSAMSGTDVLGKMVAQMESAGVSTNKMSFALEGMASDTTDLIPLLSKSGDELARLRGEYRDIGKALSQGDIDKIKTVGESFDKLSSAFSAGSQQLIADYSEQIVTAIGAIVALGSVSSNVFDVITTGNASSME